RSVGTGAAAGGECLGWLRWRRPSPSPCDVGSAEPAGCPKHPASARPALGGRYSPAGSGAGLSGLLLIGLQGEPSRAGGGEAVPRLIPPGQAAVPPFREAGVARNERNSGQAAGKIGAFLPMARQSDADRRAGELTP